MKTVKARNNTSNKIVIIMIFIIFLFVGSSFVYFGIKSYQNEIATESWPQTEGIIISSDIYSSSGDHSTTYGANIVYQYQVNGINYTSDDVSSADFSSSDSSHAQRIINKYYVGKNVIVYYNPSNPSDAVLEPGTTWISYIIILFGILPIVVASLVLYFMVIRKKLKNIELILDKSTFSPGEFIKGNVSINFNKPVTAEALKVTFVGEKIIPSRDRHSSSQTIYHDEIILDKQNEYFNNFYTFEIKIPEDILERMSNWIDEQVPYEWAKKIYTASQNLGLMRTYDNYYIEVFLEIHGKIDIRNTIEIKIV